MTIFQSFLEAFVSLSSNKARSALTMLGIVIGVAAVIAMMAIGAGAQNAITSQIESIGTNLLYVRSGGDATNPQPLTLADAKALSNERMAPSIGKVAPIIQSQATVAVPGETTVTSLLAVTPEFFEVQTAAASEGQMISQENLDDYAAVVMLGSDVAKTLFNRTAHLVGEKVRINGQIFRVIGVLKPEGGNAFSRADDRVIVPLSTARLRLVRSGESDQVDQIYVQAKNSELVPAAQDEVKQILRSRHYKNLGVDDFDILSTQAFLDTMTQVTGTMTLFLGGIAGVSLLVGGIGIMNIMLVTVTERTREIGLRKAVGARRADIRLQFLVESAFLSLGGGFIGILAGWGISALVGRLAAGTGTTLDPSIELHSVMLAILFSAAVGLFFGIYPANRAAMLEPVEALRTE